MCMVTRSMSNKVCAVDKGGSFSGLVVYSQGARKSVLTLLFSINLSVKVCATVSGGGELKMG